MRRTGLEMRRVRVLAFEMFFSLYGKKEKDYSNERKEEKRKKRKEKEKEKST